MTTLEKNITNKMQIIGIPTAQPDLSKIKSLPGYVNEQAAELSGLYNVKFEDKQLLFQYNKNHNAFFYYFINKDKYSYDFIKDIEQTLASIEEDTKYINNPGPVVYTLHYLDTAKNMEFAYYLSTHGAGMFHRDLYNFTGSTMTFTYEKPGRPYSIITSISHTRDDAIVFEIAFFLNITGKAEIRDVLDDLIRFAAKESDNIFDEIEKKFGSKKSN